MRMVGPESSRSAGRTGAGPRRRVDVARSGLRPRPTPAGAPASGATDRGGGPSPAPSSASSASSGELRRRFAVGDAGDGISALQRHYGGVSLGTIRAAQQYLVEDGMLDTQQGRGAFVIASESRRGLDVAAAVTQARDTLGVVLEALSAKTAGTVTFDQRGDDGTYFVLTTALEDFAYRQRDQAQHDVDEDGKPDAGRLGRAAGADALRDQVEAGLSSEHRPVPTNPTSAAPADTMQRSLSA